MAKALFAHPGAADPRVVHRLTQENHRLRQRVADLEQIVIRLSEDADHRAATGEVLEPV